MTLAGTWPHADVVATLEGTRPCTAHEHDMLVQALNDHFVDHGGDHPIRYSDQLDSDPLDGHHGT